MPPFHEMSEQQKREVADELMMQPSAFGILVIAAALLIVAFVWSPFVDLLREAACPLPIRRK
jgi:hypothetical protein